MKLEQVESKNKSELWVKRSLVFELPKKVEDFLEDLAKLCGTTFDEILRGELRGIFESFYQGGYFDNWIRDGIIRRGLEQELGCWNPVMDIKTRMLLVQMEKAISHLEVGVRSLGIYIKHLKDEAGRL